MQANLVDNVRKKICKGYNKFFQIILIITMVYGEKYIGYISHVSPRSGTTPLQTVYSRGYFFTDGQDSTDKII